jgi:hypothetical protein
MAQKDLDFEAPLTFLNHNKLYQAEKPYGFKVPLEGTEIPSSNIDHSAGIPAHVTDMRGFEQSFSLAENGFSVFQVQDQLSYDDYHDQTKVQEYFREVEILLRDHLGAKTVKVFRHAVSNAPQGMLWMKLKSLQIRKRHPDWPKNTQDIYQFDQPTTTVHIGQ